MKEKQSSAETMKEIVTFAIQNEIATHCYILQNIV